MIYFKDLIKSPKRLYPIIICGYQMCSYVIDAVANKIKNEETHKPENGKKKFLSFPK